MLLRAHHAAGGPSCLGGHHAAGGRGPRCFGAHHTAFPWPRWWPLWELTWRLFLGLFLTVLLPFFTFRFTFFALSVSCLLIPSLLPFSLSFISSLPPTGRRASCSVLLCRPFSAASGEGRGVCCRGHCQQDWYLPTCYRCQGCYIYPSSHAVLPASAFQLAKLPTSLLLPPSQLALTPAITSCQLACPRFQWTTPGQVIEQSVGGSSDIISLMKMYLPLLIQQRPPNVSIANIRLAIATLPAKPVPAITT